MIRRFLNALGPIGHSEFGNYVMSTRDRCNDCEGNPTLDDARRDFREMMRSRHSTIVG